MDSKSDKPIVHANTLVEKVLSACCGSIITSLVTTPFDVVKTRIQFQSLNIQNERSRLPIPFQAQCCYNADFCRGPTNPLPYAYSQLNIFNKEISRDLMKFNGTIDAFVKIFRFEGASKLWRGLSPTLLSAFPSTVIYYAGYDALKDWLNDTYIPPNSSLYWYTPMIAGGGARSLSATFISPLELLRTRLQSASQNQSTLDVLTGLKNMVKNEGIISLWRGLTPTLWRDIPFSAIYWMGYETIKTELNKKENISDSPFTVSFLSGAMSGMIAAFITTPFDVIKTRKQVEVKQTFSAHGKTKSVGVLSTMRHIIANEGARELFRGLTPRVIKVAPACAIMVSSYEFGKRFFSERHYNTGMLIKSEATDEPPFDWPCCHVMNITFY